MNKHRGDVRRFTILSESWYGASCLQRAEYTEQIMFGMYDPGGGTSGEFAIRWIPLGGESSPVLMVFSDAWSALSQFPELLKQMAVWDSKRVSPMMVKQWLATTNIIDATERKTDAITRKLYTSKPSSEDDRA